MKTKILAIVLLTFAMAMISCEKECEECREVMEVKIVRITDVTSSSATIEVEWYNLDIDYGGVGLIFRREDWPLGKSTEPGKSNTIVLNSLTPGKEYHVKAYFLPDGSEIPEDNVLSLVKSFRTLD